MDQPISGALDWSQVFELDPDAVLEQIEYDNSCWQEPVPPESEDSVATVSVTFYPGAQIQSTLPDAILVSSDAVSFYINAELLLRASGNSFHFLLSPRPSLSGGYALVGYVEDDSSTLNIILHSIYSLSCAQYSPTFPQIVTAIRRLEHYGIEAKTIVVPNSPLYTLFLSHAPLVPLDVYTLAAKYHLEELAVAASSHLLGFPLFALKDEVVEEMGPIYLKRLFFLHFGRSEALKRILLSPLYPHPPTQTCDFARQRNLTRSWALASASLVWDSRPDLPLSTLESALRPLKLTINCDECKEGLESRIKTLVIQWSQVKTTI